jgi:hypothetical protein
VAWTGAWMERCIAGSLQEGSSLGWTLHGVVVDT